MPEAIQNTEFKAIYLRNYEMVYRICFVYMKNPQDAEDCTEDVFVKVLNGDYEFRGEEQEKAWLSITAMNICKNRLKHWWNKRVTYDEVDEALLATASVQYDDTLECVLALPKKYKDVVYMHYYMGFTTDKIATIVKKPSSTVRNLLRDGRKKLETVLGGDD